MTDEMFIGIVIVLNSFIGALIIQLLFHNLTATYMTFLMGIILSLIAIVYINQFMEEE